MADIKEKIKKLLSLATSPNENEARAALLKARELMAKHKLSEVDFEGKDKQELVHFECDIKWTTDSGKVWMTSLCKLIAENHCCVASWIHSKGRRTYSLCITGMKDDAELCTQIIGYAVGYVENAIQILQRKYRRSDPKAVMNSYAEGFILGLELAYDEQKDEHQEWGLVLVKPKEVTEYESTLGSKDVRTRKTDFNAVAFTKGQNDGMNFNSGKILGNAI